MRDTTQERGPASPPSPAHTRDTRSVAATTDSPPAIALELREKWAREHARRTWAFGAIREHLAEQPSPAAIRNVARLWCRDITHLADELAKARQDMEHNE